MKLMFWRKNKKQAAELDAIEREAAKVHEQNIQKIQTTRGKLDTLNTVLNENNIVFQLAHVIGHKR